MRRRQLPPLPGNHGRHRHRCHRREGAARRQWFTPIEEVAQIAASGDDPRHGRAALGTAGGSARGAGGELWRGAPLFHRQQGAQHRHPPAWARSADSRSTNTASSAATSGSAARPRRRLSPPSACPSSRRSCARTAARSKRPRRGAACRAGASSPTSAAISMSTARPPTATTRSRRWREAAHARGLRLHRHHRAFAPSRHGAWARPAPPARGRCTRSTASSAKSAGITLLKGIEVDILEDGTLDLPD